MKKFLVTYLAPVSARAQMANLTPDQAKAGVAAWLGWKTKAGSAVIDLGSPCGNSATVSGGKTTDSNSELGGYSLLQAESREAIGKLLAEHPHLAMPGAKIEIHELLPIPGM